VTYSIPPANVAPASDVISLDERSSSLRRSIRHVKSHAPNPAATAADEGQNYDSNNMVTQGKSGAHSQSLKLKVTPASDVIALYERSRSLRRSIRHVKSHAPNPAATAADEGQY
jgi:hypothetical protein